MDAKHHGYEVRRHREVVGVGAVMRHQDPAGQALFKHMAAVAGGGLRHLIVEDQRVAQQQGAQGGAALQRLAELLGAPCAGAVPEAWAMPSDELVSTPNSRGSPTMPPRPACPTSAAPPSDSSWIGEIHPLSGKCTASITCSVRCRTWCVVNVICCIHGRSQFSSSFGKAPSS
jgi:hypothetical protein